MDPGAMKGACMIRSRWAAVATLGVSAIPAMSGWAGEAGDLPCVSGIHPHLAMYNNEGECGTGAVVPWAGRLWVVTYGPHLFKGSSDKLYEIAPSLDRVIRPESIGGTHANRMIHKESGQLFIGYHAIDADGKVRTIPWQSMPGRLTGAARHLTDPANRIYMATMEEGLYEVDVKTLAVKELIRDGNIKDVKGLRLPEKGLHSQLPGYHGKGLYTGQGRLVYANNGEQDPRIKTDPTIPSGALAEWTGEGDWRMVRRNQFTEVRGPGDLAGNPNPATDPVWSLGWDHRSLILMLLDGGRWHAYRLPKGSHSYDGSHGWNTEWPRIRDIGEADFLGTMHGTFWRFPKAFSLAHSAGIVPRSNYLKVVGDFCRWGDRVVLGCDDSAKSEFINTRPFKSAQGAPGQSHSNLWFVEPALLDRLGPAIGRGSVWLREDVKAGAPSDPFLFAGYDRRMVHLAHGTDQAVRVTLEVDRAGADRWEPLRTIDVPAKGYAFHVFAEGEVGAWVRLTTDRDASGMSACFQYANRDPRTPRNDAIFDGLAAAGAKAVSGGLLWSLGESRGVLGVAACRASAAGAEELGYYELDGDLRLRKKDAAADLARVRKTEPPADPVQADAASVLVVEDGKRYRLPRNPAYEAAHPCGTPRVCREVVTERDVFNCHGTVYELPARNAGGLAKIRPIATHNLALHDYASFRGMMVVTGLDAAAIKAGGRVVVSDDGKCAVWCGVIDDLWRLGKPRGEGGPWKGTKVEAGAPSDPYLMTGYDRKTLSLSVDGGGPVTLAVEADPDGTGLWCAYRSFPVEPGKPVEHVFPEGFNAYWVRVTADKSTTATAWFRYD
jgi:hypothetical protein